MTDARPFSELCCAWWSVVRLPALPVALLFSLTVATPSPAQTLRGVVVEDGRDTPVVGAAVSLMDRDGTRRASALSDSLGRFVLVPPRAGEYTVEAARIGYETTRSPLFSITLDGSVPFEILMRPSPIGLEGLEVTATREAERLLGTYGLTPASLRDRWIDREAIEKMPLPVGPLEVIRWRAIAGVIVAESRSLVDGLCVTFVRRGGCAIILLNGVEISSVDAQGMNPLDLEAIAILTPMDATTFFGTRGGNGAVLMWTRAGGG